MILFRVVFPRQIFIETGASVSMFKIYFCFVTQNPTATVTEVKSKSKNKWRPVALDTVVSGM